MADVGARSFGRGRAEHRACWRERVEAQGSSGLSAAGYCREHGLARASFYRWRRIFSAEVSAEKPTVFAELRVSAPSVSSVSSEASGVEVVVSGERRIRVKPGFDEDTLRRAVAILESLPC